MLANSVASMLRAARSLPDLLGSWWSRVWMGSGFYSSSSFCRIAVGLVTLGAMRLALRGDYPIFLEAQNPDLYDPVGLLILFGSEMPNAEVFSTFKAVLSVSVWMMIFGLFTRISTSVTVLSFSCLVSLNYSFSDHWSHGVNVVLLAGIAIMFAGGGRWSADSLLETLVYRRAVPSWQRQSWAKPSVLMGQFTVALVFFNAGMWKTVLSGNGLTWANSDNLRNILQLQYWVLSHPLPDWAQFVVSHEWAYKGLAFGNLVGQFVPLAAFLFIKRPWLRFFCGMFFVIEVCALCYVMGMKLMHWIPLIAFFVDWDRLVKAMGAWCVRIRLWVGQKTGRSRGTTKVGFLSSFFFPVTKAGETERTDSMAGTRSGEIYSPRLPIIAATLFVTFSTYVAFGHHKQRRYTFPFSSYPMYSALYLQEPYDEHRPYYLRASIWKIESDPPLPEEAYGWVRTSYYTQPWRKGDPKVFIQGLRTNLENKYDVRIQSFVVEKALYEILAYPETGVEPSVWARYYDDSTGEPRFVTSSIGKDKSEPDSAYVTASGHGFDDPDLSFAYYHDYRGELSELEGEWKGDRFYFSRRYLGRKLIVVRVKEKGSGEIHHYGGPRHRGSPKK